jgi:hypothetical protein
VMILMPRAGNLPVMFETGLAAQSALKAKSSRFRLSAQRHSTNE